MSGKIPQSFINDLLDRLDIVELIGQRVPLKRRGNNFVACCPFHDEKTPSFNVSQNKQLYHCFGCGASGNAIKFVMEYDRQDFVDVIEDLAGSLGLAVPVEGRQHRQRSDAEVAAKEKAFTLLARSQQYFESQLRTHPEAVKAIQYCQQRGLDGRTCQRFNIGYAPNTWDGLKKHLAQHHFSTKDGASQGVLAEKNGRHYDRFRERLMFPIRNRSGKTVGFGGRVLGQGEPKYLNSPETSLFQKSHELYGFYECKQYNRKLEEIVIVEGYMDVIALFQQGLPNAVATLGTATSSHHIQQIFRQVDKLVFCFDGDKAGRKAAWAALQVCLPHVRGGRDVRFMFLPEGEDPDTLIRKSGLEQFKQQLSQAHSLAHYLLSSLLNQSAIDTIEGKTKFIHMARPLISSVGDPTYRSLLCQHLASGIGISVEEFLSHTGSGGQGANKTQQTEDTLSPLSHGISLVLQHPTLIAKQNISLDDLREFNLPGVDVLIKLLEILAINPHISTARLINEWQNPSFQRRLEILAARQRPGGDETIVEEFNDCLISIKNAHKAQRIADLQEKARLATINEHEKRELNALLLNNR